jgi:hypothetical protein
MRNLAAVAVLVGGLLLARHNGAILVAALVIAYLLAKSPGTPRPVVGHSHGGQRDKVTIHEAAHVVTARAVGGVVESAELHRNGGGLVRWHHRSHPGEEQLRIANIAFLRAGEYAAGVKAGCSGDRAAVKAELRHIPAKDRARVLAAGEAEARRIVSARSGEIRQVARKLNEKGRL